MSTSQSVIGLGESPRSPTCLPVYPQEIVPKVATRGTLCTQERNNCSGRRNYVAQYLIGRESVIG